MSIGAPRHEQVPDEELVRRYQATADSDCFAELFVRHRKKVYFACRGFFSDGGGAEDATQETFLRAHQNLSQFCGGNFEAWLMRIARNVCIDLWRKRRPEVEPEEMESGGLLAHDGMERASDLHIAVERMHKEMEALSPDQRRCLELKIEGYSYEETAVRTGLSIGAVKSHLQNGRRALWLKMQGTLSQLK